MAFRRRFLGTAVFFLSALVYAKRGLLAFGRATRALFIPLGPLGLKALIHPYRAVLALRRHARTLGIHELKALIGMGAGRLSLLALSVLLMVVLVGQESAAYGDDLALQGKESILFAAFAPEDEITEEEGGLVRVFEEAPAGIAAPAFGEPEGEEEEGFTHGGLALEGTAILSPLLTPGSDIDHERVRIETYIVEEGDTISTLAEEFEVSVETILVENNLSVRAYIRPGDVLKILPVDGVSHAVRKGDTLAKIALTYGGEVEKIVLANRLAGQDDLVVGEVVVIPGGKKPVVRRLVRPREFVSRDIPKPLSRMVTGAGFLWPMPSRRITQYFRWRHAGIDIADKAGTAIYAAEDGVVREAGWNRGGYGLQVVVDHGGGLSTRYAHSSKLYVAPGMQVKKGDVIAVVGSTGRSTGPHLHFEVMVGGVRVNPFRYVR